MLARRCTGSTVREVSSPQLSRGPLAGSTRNGGVQSMPRMSISLPLIVALLGILSCDKSEVVSPPMSIPASEISGSIVGWQLGDSMTISATATIVGPGTSHILASGAVRSDGRFFLSLPEPPPATLVAGISQHDTLSDPAARVLMVSGLVLANRDQSMRHWVMNQHKVSVQAPSPGDFSTHYFYADRPVHWRLTEIVGDVGVAFDLHLERGWNRVIVRTVVTETLTLSTFRVENLVSSTWYITSTLQPNKRLNPTEIAAYNLMPTHRKLMNTHVIWPPLMGHSSHAST